LKFLANGNHDRRETENRARGLRETGKENQSSLRQFVSSVRREVPAKVDTSRPSTIGQQDRPAAYILQNPTAVKVKSEAAKDF
jgi:hypothetical protein